MLFIFYKTLLLNYYFLDYKNQQWFCLISKRIKDLEYAIRDVAVVANQVKATGKKVYNLNIGDPVIFDFKTPKYISEALAEATFAGQNYYVDSLGVKELREEISIYEKGKNNVDLDPDDILVTSGVTEGIFFILAGLLENENELLIPGPSYPVYINYSRFFDGVPVEYKLNEENYWEPDIDDLRRKISDKTKAISICSPNNPTGILYDKKKIKQIIDIAGEFDLPVLSDEIYDQISFEKEYICPASLSKDVPIIGLNGFSKAHLATGWRMGYIYYHDPENKLEELKIGMQKMARARLCANSIAQFAAIKALQDPGPHTEEMVVKLKERRDYSFKRIKQIEGIDCVNADGAFYLFPKILLGEFDRWKTDKDFVIDLLKETGICTVYGSGFGNYGKGHFRLTFLPQKSTLETVYNLLEDFMK
ncbi:MAG: aminotransferase class I/II-fold pyridoxal phosphate-dependent enzyme [Candidatus Lokiarchaeota archaeon]|nr:aminotransferase class I/II-fold pyridoxal phosphate-dependent enzyme [Candidatus Lokiarchaeota archaeon]MBD3341794.1 aminotransferase class I/II-fold pyridoxal phosphate-dependent enzyme [Candidatus Lokiarchaeota archaeon]